MNGAAHFERHADIVDAVLPGNVVDAALDAISNMTFLDRGVPVPVSPVEQLTTAFCRRLLIDHTLGGAGVVQVARHEHHVALLTAICLQLLARRAAGDMCGPVVFVSSDIRLGDQLKALKVQHVRRMSLSEGNPLSAHRLTGGGEIAPVIGSVRGNTNSSLVYYNPRVGSPRVDCRRPAVVIDGTTVRNPEARARVARWASDHGAAAVCFVGDLGDTGMQATLETIGHVPVVLAITTDVVASLTHTFGRGQASPSNLGAGRLLHGATTATTVSLAASPEIDAAISNAYYALAQTPKGDKPFELELPLKLLRHGIRLAATTHAYRRACAHNPRPGEGPTAGLRRLDSREERFPANWRAWQVGHMGALRHSVRELWRELDGGNPKLAVMWSVLDDDAARPGRILIRCHSRAAAEALRADLTGDNRTADQAAVWDRIVERTDIVTFAHRSPWHGYDVQILTGAPPPWQLSSLLGAEATNTIVLAYKPEAAALERQAAAWAETLDGWRRAASRVVGAAAPAATVPPIAGTEATLTITTPGAPTLPQLDLSAVLAASAEFVDAPEEQHPNAVSVGVSGSQDCVPVVLEDGRTWWVPNEGDRATPVLVLKAGGYEHVPVGALRPGNQIVVPAGDGAESVHARLVAASRSNADVAALDAILGQFRVAARAVIGSAGSVRSAQERLAAAGAEHGGQIEAWASGRTIAPREPEDVAAVFRVADRQAPDLAVLYSVASALRELNRSLGRFVAALEGGTNSDAIERLRAVVGDVADEIVDEFVVCRVAEVRAPRTVPSAIAGRIR